MAQTLHHFIDKNKLCLSELFSLTKTFDLSICGADSYGHMACQEMKNFTLPRNLRKKIDVMEVTFNYSNIFRVISKGETLEPIHVEFGEYTRKNARYYTYYSDLFGYLDDSFEKGNVVFMLCSIEDYGGEKQKGKKMEMIAHGTTAIFIPEKGGYNLYYINSHGQDMKKTTFYDYPISKYREKRYNYEESIDVLAMKLVAKTFNNRKGCKIKINYKGNENDTYYGVNLQSGDGHGFCYIFPYVFWYYFSRFYSETRKIDDITVGSSKNLLLSGKINLFVHSILAEFNVDFKNVFIENIVEFRRKRQNINTLERCVIKSGTNMLKKICSATIKYLTQKELMVKIKPSFPDIIMQ